MVIRSESKTIMNDLNLMRGGEGEGIESAK